LTFKIIYHRLRLKYGHLSDRKKFLRETVLRIIEGEKLGRSSSANEEKDEQQEIATEEKNEENRSSKNLHSEMIGSVLDEKEFPMHRKLLFPDVHTNDNPFVSQCSNYAEGTLITENYSGKDPDR